MCTPRARLFCMARTLSVRETEERDAHPGEHGEAAQPGKVGGSERVGGSCREGPQQRCPRACPLPLILTLCSRKSRPGSEPTSRGKSANSRLSQGPQQRPGRLRHHRSHTRSSSRCTLRIQLLQGLGAEGGVGPCKAGRPRQAQRWRAAPPQQQRSPLILRIRGSAPPHNHLLAHHSAAVSSFGTAGATIHSTESQRWHSGQAARDQKAPGRRRCCTRQEGK